MDDIWFGGQPKTLGICKANVLTDHLPARHRQIKLQDWYLLPLVQKILTALQLAVCGATKVSTFGSV
jgi:hypothetical protein